MSLPELLVSMTVFMGISLVMVGLLIQNRRSSEKAIAQSDSSTQALVLFERVRQELKMGRVVANPSSTELEYWLYKLNGGQPEFGPPHRLVYLPGPGVDPDVATMSVVDQRLVRNFQGKLSNLAMMGKDGKIEFQWIPGSQLVRLYGQVGESDPQQVTRSSVRPFQFLISLNNVE